MKHFTIKKWFKVFGTWYLLTFTTYPFGLYLDGRRIL